MRKTGFMTINAGVWIDHHKAVVILITDEGEDTLQIMSDPDSPARFSGGQRVKSSHTPNDFVAEDKRARKAMAHLDKYYDDVIARLRDADTILILGPGEAKQEFIKRLEGKKLKGRIAHIGTVDKMTDREIGAHVRQLLGIGAQPTKTITARIA
jgi:stalled ribosome rescue protein Dom34